MSMATKNQMVLGALCGSLLCSCSEPQDSRFPGPIESIADIDCSDGVAAPPRPLGIIDGWGIDPGWESRVVCEHGHSHSYVDVSIPGNLCLGLNRGVGAMAAHPPIADGPGTYIAEFAAHVKNDQLIEMALSRGTDGESPDWARSVSVGLECFRPCEDATKARPRQCRPVVRFHDTPELELDLEPDPVHEERYQAMPGHSAQDYEVKCALREEYGFPLPTTATIAAEIVVEGRSIGWKIDGARVSGFGPSYQLEHSRWSCERTDGTPVENGARRLFVVGLPFGEAAKSPDEPGYELAFEHWSGNASVCAGGSPSAGESDGAWMCVRYARYAACSEADCPEACGDGTCDTWETCSTCKSDCGTCSSTGTQVAELAVASIECGQSINNGGPVSCDIVLVNDGTAGAGEFDNQLWLSHDETFSSADVLLGSCTSSALEAGSKSTITCSGTVPAATEAGTWYLGLIADSSDAVAELDENNNLGSKAITVVSDYVSPTDLIVASVDFCSESPGKVECSVTIENIGGVDAGPFVANLLLSKDEIIDPSDTLLEMITCQFPGVGAGMSQWMKCTGKIPLGIHGSHYVGVIADSLDAVPESDNGNNTGHSSTFIVVEPSPDLVVSSVSCPASATSPGQIDCAVTIKNQGDGAANFFDNEMYLSDDMTIDTFFDTELGTCQEKILSLPAGQSKTITCTGAIPAGNAGFNKYVLVNADSSFPGVDESNEDNNTGYDSVSIEQGKADLVVSSVNCPTSAMSPGMISCSVTIKNQAASGASSFTNEMWLSSNTTLDAFGDTTLGTCNVPFGLSAGQSTTITCAGSIPMGKSGFQYVVIETDSSFPGVSESDENNNTGYDSVSIQQGQVDLVVTSVACPLTATSPGLISCSVTIKNQGTIAASSLKNEMHLSDNATIDISDTLLGSCDLPFGLSAGASQTITCNGNIPVGKAGINKYVIVKADSSSQVSESNESNNTGSDTINVQ
jgi:subtilase family serine protease